MARLEWSRTVKLFSEGQVSAVERTAGGSRWTANRPASTAPVRHREARAAIAEADAQVARLKAVLAEPRCAPLAGRVEYRVVEVGTVLPRADASSRC
jgi:HlyD family secretion protein